MVAVACISQAVIADDDRSRTFVSRSRVISPFLTIVLAVAILAQYIVFAIKKRGKMGTMAYLFAFTILPLVLCLIFPGDQDKKILSDEEEEDEKGGGR